MTTDGQNSDHNAVSIVIPAFNEEGAITTGIRGIREVLDATPIEYEIIVVDDGSDLMRGSRKATSKAKCTCVGMRMTLCVHLSMRATRNASRLSAAI